MAKFPLYREFSEKNLSAQDIEQLEQLRKRCTGNILLATTLAGCGHPGGSMSSLPLLLSIYAGIRFDSQKPRDVKRDRVVISQGHISPACYSVLAELGYFPLEDMLLEFRDAGSRYAGHVEIDVPGVEWSTGNLGQGLSVGAASALAARLQGHDHRTFVIMGDGEQQKGQLAEARRFALKYELNNLIAVLDYNRLQIGGAIEKIMPQDIAEEYRADGWNVIEVDGKNFQEIFSAFACAYHSKVSNPKAPTLVVAHTVMGYGVSFMENLAKYHGQVLTAEQVEKAFIELGIEDDVHSWLEKRKQHKTQTVFPELPTLMPKCEMGTPRLYSVDQKLDDRSAYGNALADLARENNQTIPKVLGLTCDLAGSVKMNEFAKISPKCFIENGIQEHHAATLAGRLATEGFVPFFSTFGVFGVAETYNQFRLNTINRSNVKVVCTHIGLNVGEDGPTHQSIDYIGLLTSLFQLRISIPADPNQTDRIIRKIATLVGSDFVGMGRAKHAVLTDEQGNPFFGPDYEYIPGKADWLRRGVHGTIIAVGPMVEKAMAAHDSLQKESIQVGVLNMASIAPLDVDAILEASQTGPIITVEDHHVQTGLGSLVANVLAENRQACGLMKMGVTCYQSSGTPEALYQKQGLTVERICSNMKQILS